MAENNVTQIAALRKPFEERYREHRVSGGLYFAEEGFDGINAALSEAQALLTALTFVKPNDLPVDTHQWALSGIQRLIAVAHFEAREELEESGNV